MVQRMFLKMMRKVIVVAKAKPHFIVTVITFIEAAWVDSWRCFPRLMTRLQVKFVVPSWRVVAKVPCQHLWYQMEVLYSYSVYPIKALLHLSKFCSDKAHRKTQYPCPERRESFVRSIFASSQLLKVLWLSIDRSHSPKLTCSYHSHKDVVR